MACRGHKRSSSRKRVLWNTDAYIDKRRAHRVACSMLVALDVLRLEGSMLPSSSDSLSSAASTSSGDGMFGDRSQSGISHITGGNSLNETDLDCHS